MDLASLFSDLGDALAPASAPVIPGFPDPGTGAGNTQGIDFNNISRCSRSSRSETGDQGIDNFETVQAGAQAGAGERARVSCVEEREIREQREKLTGSAPYSSRSSLKKRELKEETGTAPLALPAADGLTLWRAALAGLSPDHAPCPGYRPDEWPRVLSRALAFLDEFGPQAEALGWTAPRLFGVHPEIGIVRVDHCGALVLPVGGPVRAITADTIALGHLTHRTKPGQPEGVPIWGFGR